MMTDSDAQLGYKRQQIYTLDLHADPEELRLELGKWRFVGTSAAQPIATVTEGIITVGTTDQATFNLPDIKELQNCSVDFEVRIRDDGHDPSRWAGVRLRGFVYDIRFGYLVYLRRTGTVELYRAEQVLGGANDTKVQDTMTNWTRIRVDVFDSTIRVWVDGEPHITKIDRKFADKGRVYLHTFGTIAQFRHFSVYELTD